MKQRSHNLFEFLVIITLVCLGFQLINLSGMIAGPGFEFIRVVSVLDLVFAGILMEHRWNRQVNERYQELQRKVHESYEQRALREEP